MLLRVCCSDFKSSDCRSLIVVFCLHDLCVDLDGFDIDVSENRLVLSHVSLIEVCNVIVTLKSII